MNGSGNKPFKNPQWDQNLKTIKEHRDYVLGIYRQGILNALQGTSLTRNQILDLLQPEAIFRSWVLILLQRMREEGVIGRNVDGTFFRK